MAQFKAFATGAEVTAQTALSIVDGMSTFKQTALRVLAKNGIEAPQSDHWFAQQAWLNAFQKTMTTRSRAARRARNRAHISSLGEGGDFWPCHFLPAAFALLFPAAAAFLFAGAALQPSSTSWRKYSMYLSR
jgi:hypothetical protein